MLTGARLGEVRTATFDQFNLELAIWTKQAAYMNAVEIEQAISDLAEQPFDAAEFPFAFLEAFGNKATTIKRLRAGASNKSDLGGVLQTNNIHIADLPAGQVTKTLAALKASPATPRPRRSSSSPPTARTSRPKT
jgi:hypothetical protein